MRQRPRMVLSMRNCGNWPRFVPGAAVGHSTTHGWVRGKSKNAIYIVIEADYSRCWFMLPALNRHDLPRRVYFVMHVWWRHSGRRTNISKARPRQTRTWIINFLWGNFTSLKAWMISFSHCVHSEDCISYLQREIWQLNRRNSHGDRSAVISALTRELHSFEAMISRQSSSPMCGEGNS